MSSKKHLTTLGKIGVIIFIPSFLILMFCVLIFATGTEILLSLISITSIESAEGLMVITVLFLFISLLMIYNGRETNNNE